MLVSSTPVWAASPASVVSASSCAAVSCDASVTASVWAVVSCCASVTASVSAAVSVAVSCGASVAASVTDSSVCVSVAVSLSCTSVISLPDTLCTVLPAKPASVSSFAANAAIPVPDTVIPAARTHAVNCNTALFIAFKPPKKPNQIYLLRICYISHGVIIANMNSYVKYY